MPSLATGVGKSYTGWGSRIRKMEGHYIGGLAETSKVEKTFELVE